MLCLWIQTKKQVTILLLLMFISFIASAKADVYEADLFTGWLDRILANVSFKISNITFILKEKGDAVSLKCKTLSIVSASGPPAWTADFVVHE